MNDFRYQRATSLADARSALAADPDATLLAGGMTLLPAMKHGLAAPGRLIDIGHLAELRRITLDAQGATLGAGVRHGQAADHAALAAAIPALCALAASIGDPQVRARGTIGGSVANADPAADWPAALLGLGATVHTDRRDIAADAFFTGMFETALAPAELVAAVRFPRPRRAAYAKHHHLASGYAMAGVFVAELADRTIRVAVTGAGPSVFRWHEAEAALAGRFSVDALRGLSPDATGLNADLHAPADYRAHLTGTMARRAVASLTGESV